MKFSKQLVLSTLAISGCVAALVYVGRTNAPGDSASGVAPATLPSGDGAPPSGTASKDAAKQAHAPLPGAARTVRELVPPTAWLVADFQGDITGQTPFADQEGFCKTVPAPSRVALAILPPKDGPNPDLLIAARDVSDSFWGCARDRIVVAGGTALAQNDRYEVLRSPTGVVARGPTGAMVFLTSETNLESALSVLSELSPGAGTTGAHASLFSRLRGKDQENPTVLDATLALSPDWLASVGQDKDKSPLRFIQTAYLSAREDGSAQGGIDCDEAGCREVLGFLERAKTDLIETLPPVARSAILNSLRAEHVVGAGRIAITWTPTEVPLTELINRFFGPGMLAP